MTETDNQYTEYTELHPLSNFEGVHKFKSVNRAIKRGHVSPQGIVYPRRPFNNRKPTRGRALNVEKMKIYAQLKQKGLL